jgi:hypothetical protein
MCSEGQTERRRPYLDKASRIVTTEGLSLQNKQKRHEVCGSPQAFSAISLSNRRAVVQSIQALISSIPLIRPADLST